MADTTFATGTVIAVDWLNDVNDFVYGGGILASGVSNTPAGNIAATNVQTAINELDTEKGGLSTANSWTAQQTFKETKETVYNLTGTVIDPANGTIQYKTLTGNTTFTESLEEGQSLTLMINDGTAYTVTWPTMTWVGGSAPTLATTGYTVVVLWKISTTLYGKHIGNA